MQIVIRLQLHFLTSSYCTMTLYCTVKSFAGRNRKYASLILSDPLVFSHSIVSCTEKHIHTHTIQINDFIHNALISAVKRNLMFFFLHLHIIISIHRQIFNLLLFDLGKIACITINLWQNAEITFCQIACDSTIVLSTLRPAVIITGNLLIVLKK